MLFPALYLLSVTAANVVTAHFAPFVIGLLIVPMGSFLIGATFVLRDFPQVNFGRKKKYLTILAASFLSLVASLILGDGFWVVVASLLAFLVSELTDTEIFTRMKASLLNRVLFSGLVGGLLDSVIFVVVGLGPIGLGVLSWEQCLFAIIGQTLVKMAMQFIGVGVIGILFRVNRETVQRRN